jgi:hypothetical protein
MEEYIKDAFDKVEVSPERMKHIVKDALFEGASAAACTPGPRMKPRMFRKAAMVVIAAVITLAMCTTALGIDIGVNAPLLKLLNADDQDEKQLADDSSLVISESATSKDVDVNVSMVVGNEHLFYIMFNADLSGLPEYTDKGNEKLFYNFPNTMLTDDDAGDGGFLPVNSRTYPIEGDGNDGRTWFAFEGRSSENLQGRNVTLSLGELHGMTKVVSEGEELLKDVVVVNGDWFVDFTFDYKRDSLDLGGGKATAKPPRGYTVSTSDLSIRNVLLSPLSLSFDVAGDGKALEAIPPEGWDGEYAGPESRPDTTSYIWKYLPVTARMKDGTELDLWAELDTEYKGQIGSAEIPEAGDFMITYDSKAEGINSSDSHEISVTIKFKNLMDTSDFESIAIGGLTLPVR